MPFERWLPLFCIDLLFVACRCENLRVTAKIFMGNWRKIHGQLEKKLSAMFSEMMGNVFQNHRQ